MLWNTHIHLETQTEEVFIVGKMTRVPSEMTTNPQLRRNYVEKMGNFSLKKKKKREKNMITALYLYFFKQWIGLFININNSEKKNVVDLKNF